jgi:hypothetical protein
MEYEGLSQDLQTRDGVSNTNIMMSEIIVIKSVTPVGGSANNSVSRGT